jgi:hypothetical protein
LTADEAIAFGALVAVAAMIYGLRAVLRKKA